MDEVRRLADAVLYEGHLLWPYRRSALKNQRRWTFGGVFPRAHAERHPDDRAEARTQVLVEGPASATLDVELRFLHVVRRQAQHAGAPVDELVAGGERHLTWDEATEREAAVRGLTLASLATRPRCTPVDVRAGRDVEDLPGEGDAIVRSWRGIVATLDVHAAPAGEDVHRVVVRVANASPWDGGSREDAQRRALCSAHVVLRVAGGGIVSATDPPERHARAAAECRQEGLWPVLVGPPGSGDTALAAPIILEDHPRIAPESPGDLFDGGEIDQMLTLNILSLTEEERAEMRDSDPRAREILERTEALTEEEIMRLNGAIREFSAVRDR
jgi:hypothetical protein